MLQTSAAAAPCTGDSFAVEPHYDPMFFTIRCSCGASEVIAVGSDRLGVFFLRHGARLPLPNRAARPWPSKVRERVALQVLEGGRA